MSRFVALTALFIAMLMMVILAAPEIRAADQDNVTVVAVRGKVSRKDQDTGKWKALAKGDRLTATDAVRTAAGAVADLDINGISSIRLSENTTLEIAELAIGKKENGRDNLKAKLNLRKGNVLCDVKPLTDKSVFEVATPVSVAGVRGTGISVTTDGRDYAASACINGVLDVDGRQVQPKTQSISRDGSVSVEEIPDEEWQFLKQALQELVSNVESSRMKRLLNQIPKTGDDDLIKLTNAFKALFLLDQVVRSADARLTEVGAELKENIAFWKKSDNTDKLKEQTVAAVAEARQRYEAVYKKLSQRTEQQIAGVPDKFKKLMAAIEQLSGNLSDDQTRDILDQFTVPPYDLRPEVIAELKELAATAAGLPRDPASAAALEEIRAAMESLIEYAGLAGDPEATDLLKQVTGAQAALPALADPKIKMDELLEQARALPVMYESLFVLDEILKRMEEVATAAGIRNQSAVGTMFEELETIRREMELNRPLTEEERRSQVKSSLEGMFSAYEKEDVNRFGEFIDPTFYNNDDNGFRHRRDEFIESVRKDFNHFDNIEFALRVKSMEFIGDNVTVRVNWDRRVILAESNSEWKIINLETKLSFILSSVGMYQLYRIEGTAIMGLSSLYTGATLITGGTVDGVTVTDALQVTETLNAIDATSATFPEAPPAVVSGGGSQTYTLTSDRVINVGEQWALNSGDQVYCAPGVKIIVNGGTLQGHGATFTTSGGGNWGGVQFQSASASSYLLNCPINNVDTAVFVNNTSGISISSCNINAATYGVVTQNSSVSISSNTFTTTGGNTAIKIMGTGNVTTSNNMVMTYGYGLWAFNFTGTLTSLFDNFTSGSYGAYIEGAGTYNFMNSTFMSNAQRGIHVQSGAGTNVSLVNCNSTFNTNYGVFGNSAGGAATTLNGCYLSNNNGAAGSDTDVTVPNSGAATPQYWNVNSVVNPKAVSN